MKETTKKTKEVGKYKKDVIYTKWGLANSYKEHIEISEDLKKYPILHAHVLEHEQGHVEQFDLWHEFQWGRMTFYLLLFVLSHPKTWTDLSPFMYKEGAIYYDENKLILYGVGLMALFFGWVFFFT